MLESNNIKPQESTGDIHSPLLSTDDRLVSLSQPSQAVPLGSRSLSMSSGSPEAFCLVVFLFLVFQDRVSFSVALHSCLPARASPVLGLKA